jgi:hypothetical protein
MRAINATQRKAERFTLMLDGDTAGRRATATIAAQLRPHAGVRVIHLPDTVQPDQLKPEAIRGRQFLKAWLFGLLFFGSPYSLIADQRSALLSRTKSSRTKSSLAGRRSSCEDAPQRPFKCEFAPSHLVSRKLSWW